MVDLVAELVELHLLAPTPGPRLEGHNPEAGPRQHVRGDAACGAEPDDHDVGVRGSRTHQGPVGAEPLVALGPDVPWPGVADQLPAGATGVAAVVRVAEHALHRVGEDELEEAVAGARLGRAQEVVAQLG